PAWVAVGDVEAVEPKLELGIGQARVRGDESPFGRNEVGVLLERRVDAGAEFGGKGGKVLPVMRLGLRLDDVRADRRDTQPDKKNRPGGDGPASATAPAGRAGRAVTRQHRPVATDGHPSVSAVLGAGCRNVYPA